MKLLWAGQVTAARAPSLSADNLTPIEKCFHQELGGGAAAQRWGLLKEAHCGDLERPKPGAASPETTQTRNDGGNGVVCCHSSLGEVGVRS